MAAPAASPNPAIAVADPVLDPRLKKQLHEVVMAELYEPVLGKQRERLDNIIVQNAKLKSQSYFLSFEGQVYRHSTVSEKARLPLAIPRLCTKLRPAMKAWLETQKRLDHEQLITGGVVAAIFLASNHYEDWLRLLPDCIRDGAEAFLSGSTLPTHYPRLSDEQVQAFLDKQAPYLLKIRERRVLNLIQA